MSELQALREFRSDAALPPELRDVARGKLETLIAESPHRRRSRWLVLATAAAAVLVGAATAYALAREYLVGDPAPPGVKEQAALLNEVKGELIPRVHEGPRIRVEETRLAASLEASTGLVYLWVAPTDRGDYCLFSQVVGTELPNGRPNLSGGCRRGSAPVDSTFSGTRVRDGRWLPLIYGRVDPRVQQLQVIVKDKTLDVPLTGRFFLFELPGVADGEQPDIEVVGRDASGNELARRKHGVPDAFGTHPPQEIDLSREKPLLEVLTRRTKKPLRLYLVERDGRRCDVLDGPGGTSAGCGGGPPGPREIPIGPTQIGTAPRGMLLLWGEVGRAITRLELHFEDGRVERLPLVEQFTLYQVDPRDFAAGRRPVALIGRDESGEVVAKRKLGPWQR